MNGWNVWLLYKVQLNPAAPPRAAACQTGRQSARKTTERRARTSGQPPSSGSSLSKAFSKMTADLGFGHIVASEIDAPNMFVKLV